jgi:hypothetical protein
MGLEYNARVFWCLILNEAVHPLIKSFCRLNGIWPASIIHIDDQPLQYLQSAYSNKLQQGRHFKDGISATMSSSDQV